MVALRSFIPEMEQVAIHRLLGNPTASQTKPMWIRVTVSCRRKCCNYGQCVAVRFTLPGLGGLLAEMLCTVRVKLHTKAVPPANKTEVEMMTDTAQSAFL